MIGAAVAIEDQVRHAMMDDMVVEEDRPVAERPAIVGRALARPVHLVAAIDVDAQRPVPPRPQRPRQHGEKGPMRSLEEEKGSGLGGNPGTTRRTTSSIYDTSPGKSAVQSTTT